MLAGTVSLGAAEHEVRAREKHEKAALQIAEAPAVDVRIEVADATNLPLEDDLVDLCITSPPYGLDKLYRSSADSAEGWQNFMDDWLAEAHRVSKSGGRLALNVPLDTTVGGFRPTYAQAVDCARRAGWTYRSTIVWDENTVSKSTGRGSVDSAGSPHVITPVEMIALFSKGAWKREPPRGIVSDLEHDEWLSWTNGHWRFGGEARGWEGHPAPFPEELPRRLIKLLSFQGDIVLDPFGGSGTTALVARRLRRTPIAFDLSEEYVASARRRVAKASSDESEAQEQPGLDLFTGASEPMGEQRGAAASVGAR